MIQLNFKFDNKQISSNVTEHIKENGVIEYEVEIEDDEIAKEFESPIFFKIEDNFFGFKDSQNRQRQRDLDLLFAFKNALDWFRSKQPDMKI